MEKFMNCLNYLKIDEDGYLDYDDDNYDLYTWYYWLLRTFNELPTNIKSRKLYENLYYLSEVDEIQHLHLIKSNNQYHFVISFLIGYYVCQGCGSYSCNSCSRSSGSHWTTEYKSFLVNINLSDLNENQINYIFEKFVSNKRCINVVSERSYECDANNLINSFIKYVDTYRVLLNILPNDIANLVILF